MADSGVKNVIMIPWTLFSAQAHITQGHATNNAKPLMMKLMVKESR
jgi:hypothetical protein